MSNPAKITAIYPDDSATLYALLRRPSDGYIYDVGDAAFEAVGTWNAARMDECDIAMTNKKGFFFTVDFPSVTDDVPYVIEVCLRAGGSPAASDPILSSIGINEVLTARVGVLNVYDET